MSNPNVLTVDDEKNIRLTLASTLEAFNIASDTARNGKEAMQKLAEKFFQLMLFDLLFRTPFKARGSGEG